MRFTRCLVWKFEASCLFICLLFSNYTFWQKHDKPKFITVAVFSDNGDVITGDSNGTIYVWDCNEHRIRRAIKDAHAVNSVISVSVCCIISVCMQGAVLALTVAQNGLMISGGKDRKIIEWDEAFTKTGRNVEVSWDRLVVLLHTCACMQKWQMV